MQVKYSPLNISPVPSLFKQSELPIKKKPRNDHPSKHQIKGVRVGDGSKPHTGHFVQKSLAKKLSQRGGRKFGERYDELATYKYTLPCISITFFRAIGRGLAAAIQIRKLDRGISDCHV